MKKLLRSIGYALQLLVVGTIGFCTWNFWSAGDRVKALCAQIQPGWSMDALRAFAKAHDLGPQGAHPGTNYLMESRSFGRFGCKVEVDAAGVASSTYTHSD